MGAGMGLSIGSRNLSKIIASPFKKPHRTAARNMLRVYSHPMASFGRYFFGTGEYPAKISVKTPDGVIALDVYSHHDMLTINEIFCRLDYFADASDKVVVDFGSNIGISAAYFLTRSPDAQVYLFEPVSFNIERLRRNLASFEGRYTLSETAVGLSEGEVTFGWEDTGRYGGVGLDTGHNITVPCVDSNAVLEAALQKHGRIDILKIDIETLEKQVTTRIPLEMAQKIGKIYIEYAFESNPLERTHSMTQYGAVAQFVNLARLPSEK
jgi:FkbM family methyltransferase